MNMRKRRKILQRHLLHQKKHKIRKSKDTDDQRRYYIPKEPGMDWVDIYYIECQRYDNQEIIENAFKVITDIFATENVEIKRKYGLRDVSIFGAPYGSNERSSGLIQLADSKLPFPENTIFLFCADNDELVREVLPHEFMHYLTPNFPAFWAEILTEMALRKKFPDRTDHYDDLLEIAGTMIAAASYKLNIPSEEIVEKMLNFFLNNNVKALRQYFNSIFGEGMFKDFRDTDTLSNYERMCYWLRKSKIPESFIKNCATKICLEYKEG